MRLSVCHYIGSYFKRTRSRLSRDGFFVLRHTERTCSGAVPLLAIFEFSLRYLNIFAIFRQMLIFDISIGFVQTRYRLPLVGFSYPLAYEISIFWSCALKEKWNFGDFLEIFFSYFTTNILVIIRYSFIFDLSF